MNIGIIGSGNIGGTLTRRLRSLGHDVAVANSRGPESLADLASETGATPVTVEQAARGNRDLVVVTIPMKRVQELPRDLFAAIPRDPIVVDTNNYYPQQRDGRIDGIENGTPESRWVEQQLGHPVVKTFNNIYAAHLLANGKPRGTAGRIALPVAGDDAAAKRVVMQLVDDLGFDPLDAGSIDESWRQQPGTPSYAQDFDLEQLRRGLAAATKERAPEWRATAERPGTHEADRSPSRF